MSIQDYFNRQDQKKAQENISEILLQQKHSEIRKKISKMLEGQSNGN